MKTTQYFKYSVMARRPYLKEEWLENVLNNPIRIEMQTNGRIRYWGFISEMGKYLRVVTNQMVEPYTMLCKKVVLSPHIEETRL